MGFFSTEYPDCPYCSGIGSLPGGGGHSDACPQRRDCCPTCHGMGKVRKVEFTTKKVKVYCRECSGAGRMTSYKCYPDGTPLKGTEKEVACKHCGGKGRWTENRKVVASVTPLSDSEALRYLERKRRER